MGQTETQMPQPMQELFEVSSVSCLMAKLMTSIPTWQLRVHSVQPIHLSLETI